MAKQTKSGLSSVVSGLMRAAAGGDTSNVADQDLDKHVADMLLQEAKAKSKKYNNIGIGAFLPNSRTTRDTLPNINKRFLLNVIKATDSHNQALIRASDGQAEANSRHMEQKEDMRSYRRSSSSSYGSKRRRNSKRRSPSTDIDSRVRTPSRSGSPHERESDDDQSSGSTLTRLSSYSEKPIVFKGRGNITAGGPSAMNKYFVPSYDPNQDPGDVVDDDGWVLDPGNGQIGKNEKKKKKKKKSNRNVEEDLHRHKRKKTKEDKSDRTITIIPNNQTLNDKIVHRKGVREWDLEKKGQRDKMSRVPR